MTTTAHHFVTGLTLSPAPVSVDSSIRGSGDVVDLTAPAVAQQVSVTPGMSSTPSVTAGTRDLSTRGQHFATKLPESIAVHDDASRACSEENAEHSGVFDLAAAELVKYRAGESYALRSLIDLAGPFVERVVRIMGVEPWAVDDVSQAVWCKFLSSQSSIDQPKALLGWLSTVAKRESLRWHRSQKRVGSSPTESLDFSAQQDIGHDADRFSDADSRSGSLGSAAVEPEAVAERKERDLLLREHIQRLPERSQRILVAVANSTRPDYRSLAAELGVAIGSIGPLRARCLRQLRLSLDTDPRWCGLGPTNPSH